MMTNNSNNTSKGLYDDEIDCLGSRMLKGKMTGWMGVFVRDELPSEEELLRAQMQFDNRPFAFVFKTSRLVNLDSTLSPTADGEHR